MKLRLKFLGLVWQHSCLAITTSLMSYITQQWPSMRFDNCSSSTQAFQSWEQVGHSAKAIEKDLTFILPTLDKNSSIYQGMPTWSSLLSSNLRSCNWHQKHVAHVTRGELSPSSFLGQFSTVRYIPFGLVLNVVEDYYCIYPGPLAWLQRVWLSSLPSLSAINCLDGILLLPMEFTNVVRRGGVLAIFASLFMFFSCAVHLPLTILWDDTCRDLSGTTDYSHSVVSFLNTTIPVCDAICFIHSRDA